MPSEPQEMPVKTLLSKFSLGEQYQMEAPVVFKKDGVWSIRVLLGSLFQDGKHELDWGYFKTDKDGVITESPKGYAKEYNGTKITDLEDYSSDATS